MRSPVPFGFDLAALLGFLGVMAWLTHVNPTVVP
jgi:hypothetical protein